MAPKRKATPAKAAAEESAAKVSKTEEKKEEPKKEEPKKEEPAEPKEAEVEEEPKEKEVDDKKDTRATIKEAVCFHNVETTLNVVPAADGRLLMSLTDGGMQFLIAGARGNVGIKSGRYFYEVRVVEALMLNEGRNPGRSRPPVPRQLVRVGFSLAGSSLVLGDGSETGVCFDSEGFFFSEKSRVPASSRFGRDQAIGVLLNLDSKSPNANTVSLFCNGQRISQPMQLPEKMKGQPLFPHVSYRNVSVQVNFGPHPMSPMPFKCRMIQEAAKDDVKEVKAEKPKDGKFEVLFPVAFPDEGTFAWLDGFLQKNPSYVELSDRKILEWAVKSGVWKPRANNSWKASNDKPEFNFGLQYMDDFSIRRCLNSITSLVPRNYVVMEVKQNLTPADRKTLLSRFKAPFFKTVAHVVMGEPPAEFKAGIQKALLDEKQAKAETEWKQRKLEKERKKAIAQRKKEIAENKAALEAKKKEEEAEKKEAGEETAEGDKKEEGEEKEGDKEKGEKIETEEKKEEEKEDKKEENGKEEKAAEEKEDLDVDEPMPKVELTEEEKKLNFKPVTTVTDITAPLLNSTFHQFCIPEKDEGFDEIRFAWQSEAKSKAYLKKWVLEKKVTSRIEDLTPSEAFQTRLAEFKKTIQEMQAKQKEFKSSKADAKGDDKTEGEERKEGEEVEENEAGETKAMDVDIFSVENVNDVGNGEPLFSSFSFEDWALLTLRYELHLLQASFRDDVNDPERIGIHENHLLFYYSRYFKKQLSPHLFGKESPQEVVELVKDAVKIDPETKVLASALDEEPEGLVAFVKMQEQNRRKREQRIDAGDETARLNFSLLQQQGSGSGYGGGGKGGWRSKGSQAAGGNASAIAATSGSAAPPGPPGGPRLVPAPRSKNWQGQKGGWQSGKAGAGRTPQTYAPRMPGKAGKKG